MNPVSFIRDKREGREHAAGEIAAFVAGLVAGTVTDYQASAWLMAAFLNGLSERETWALTDAMLHSGRVLSLRRVALPKVDKHSTGGVGDKISICLAPLVACAGVAVPMISGRGLGHTGGTLDKLQAIPGFRVDLDAKEFERTVQKLGLCLIGQTPELAPADRMLYALRDVTATVESVPLIVASILSKKLAEGIDALVLDVKCGRGAFMEDRAQARELARALVQVGKRAGKRVRALLTDMSSPIGRTVGNALETREAIEVLKNEGPPDTRRLTLELGVEMLLVGGVAESRREARARLEAALADGRALARFRDLVAAQGGDPRVVDDVARLPTAPVRLAALAPRSGYVQRIDAKALGLLAIELGAGRSRVDDVLDPSAGFELAVTVGDRVARGEPLAVVHARSRAVARRVLERTVAAFELGARAAEPLPLVLERIG